MTVSVKAIIGMAALGALALAARPSAAADHLNVGIPAPAYDFALLTVGIDAGLFKDNNLDITPISLEGSAKLHQALIAGSIDIAMGAGTDFVFIAKGAPEKGIAAMAGPPNNMAMIVAAKGPIETVADLKGKKVGVSTVGSLTYWLAQQLSIRQGWGPNGLDIVAVGGMQGEAAGLVAGNLQGGVGSLEGGLEMADKGQGRILVMFGDFVHPFLAHAIFATDAMIAKHPDEIRRFLKGWFETIAYSKTNKAETIRFSQTVTHLSDANAEEVYLNETPMFSTDGKFDLAAVDVVKKSLIDMGQVAKMPDNKDLFTEEFLPKRP
jgi:ABC-type nitrate/sulfonate/bicarbonate transport system substrate-binding protein